MKKKSSSIDRDYLIIFDLNKVNQLNSILPNQYKNLDLDHMIAIYINVQFKFKYYFSFFMYYSMQSRTFILFLKFNPIIQTNQLTEQVFGGDLSDNQSSNEYRILQN